MNIFEALRKFYAAPSWAYFEEVSNATGSMRNAYADGLAMSLWPSRGMEVHGIEVKTSRGDWLKELKNPKKAEPVFRYCDRWWLAISEPSIARVEELPRTWGLYVLNGRGLRIAKAAPPLKPKKLDRTFIASILRRACEQKQRALSKLVDPLVEARVEERLEQSKIHWERQRGFEQEQLKRSFEDLSHAVDRFREASGIEIVEPWQAGRIGHAVKEVLVRQDVSQRLHHVRKTIDEIAKHLAAIPNE